MFSRSVNCRYFIALAIFTAGCAHPPGTFRLNQAMLIPPAAKDATIVSAKIPVAKPLRKAVCDASPHGLRIQKNSILVTREAIDATTPAELFAWTTALEKQHCLPPNQAFDIAEEIVDALPLSLVKRSQLLQGRPDLKSFSSLNVIEPIRTPGATDPLISEISSVKPGENNSIVVELKSSPSVIGYEIDWYDVTAKTAGPGYRVAPRTAETHINGNVEHPATPTTPRFQFGPDASWYELNMMTKVSSNDYDFVLFSARTSAELRTAVDFFEHDATAFLKTADPATYTVLPHGTGINAYIRVAVNGKSFDLPRNKTVEQAITQAGGNPRELLPQLKIRKLHDGKLFPVEWDRTKDAILSLPLEGGEEIVW